ncbi:MAG: hypothetical protein AAB434_01190 [Planctomycetota bacterium]
MRASILVVLLSLPLFAQLPEGASLEIRIQEVTGEVEYQAAPKTPWKAAQVGDVLPVGTKLVTGVESAAALAFGTNSVALVRQVTTLDITAFGMEGDKLAAKVKIDPGVCTVSVKQLAQFQTDFQVSTPRLTASVKGTVVTTIANGGYGEPADSAEAEQNSIVVDLLNGLTNTVAQGGNATENNLDVGENALADAVFTAVDGLAGNETDANLASTTSQSTDITGSGLTGPGTSSIIANTTPPPAEPTFPDAQLTLTWGQNPGDLDLHLFMPLQQGGRDEVFFSNKTSGDGLAVLTQDDTDGFGPEVININQFTDGHYTAFVRIFSGTGDFAANPAHVQVATGAGPVVEIDSNGVGQNWTVGEFNVVNGQATFNVIDTYGATPPNN